MRLRSLLVCLCVCVISVCVRVCRIKRRASDRTNKSISRSYSTDKLFSIVVVFSFTSGGSAMHQCVKSRAASHVPPLPIIISDRRGITPLLLRAATSLGIRIRHRRSNAVINYYNNNIINTPRATTSRRTKS